MRLILLFLFMVPQLALAALPVSSPCSKQIEKMLSEWKSEGVWKKQLQGGLEKFFFASPTNIIGQWVLLSSDGLALSKADERGRVQLVFDKKCVSKSSVHPGTAPDDFTDKELRAYIEKHVTGAIYVWSPRMSLSVDGIKEIQKATNEKKIALLVLDAGDTNSFEFKMRDVGQHYPALLVFKNKRILTGIKYGHEKAAGYRRDLDNMLK